MSTDPAPAEPAVSVIIATYNRSRVLRHAIASVLHSSFRDWELIVVGDCCTDDTAVCVAAFADARIRFVNLPRRCGDQSGLNNRGVALARGRYIAFLNHDDLYLPEHLAACVAELESSGADLVFVPGAVAYPNTDAASGDRLCRFALSGVPGTAGYSPFSEYLASSWVLKRDLTGRIGPWPQRDRVYVSPSQAWLFRAWRMGAVLRFLPSVSVILVPAASRPGCYAQAESPEHEWLARWMKDDPRYRERILEDAGLSEARERVATVSRPPLRAFRRLLLRPFHALLMALGVHPLSLSNALRYGRRGGAVRAHRRRTGSV